MRGFRGKPSPGPSGGAPDGLQNASDGPPSAPPAVIEPVRRYEREKAGAGVTRAPANLAPHSAIFWHLMNVDAAGVAHEANAALSQLSATANAPVFSYLDNLFRGHDRRWSDAFGGGRERGGRGCCRSYPQRRKGR